MLSLYDKNSMSFHEKAQALLCGLAKIQPTKSNALQKGFLEPQRIVVLPLFYIIQVGIAVGVQIPTGCPVSLAVRGLDKLKSKKVLTNSSDLIEFAIIGTSQVLR